MKSVQGNNNRVLFLILGIIFSAIIGFFSYISFYEWYKVEIVADPEYLDRYLFGDPDIIAKRGWYFISSSSYAFMNFLQGSTLLLILILAIIATIKRNAWILGISAVLLIGAYIFWRWYLTQPVQPF